jgi:hypothetical protein
VTPGGARAGIQAALKSRRPVHFKVRAAVGVTLTLADGLREFIGRPAARAARPRRGREISNSARVGGRTPCIVRHCSPNSRAAGAAGGAAGGLLLSWWRAFARCSHYRGSRRFAHPRRMCGWSAPECSYIHGRCRPVLTTRIYSATIPRLRATRIATCARLMKRWKAATGCRRGTLRGQSALGGGGYFLQIAVAFTLDVGAMLGVRTRWAPPRTFR